MCAYTSSTRTTSEQIQELHPERGSFAAERIRSSCRYVQLSMDFEQPGMFTRTDALGAGYTDDDLRRARAAGELFTIRRGYFIRTDAYQLLDDHERHLLLARAVHSESSTSTVFSHVSAAVLHGMQTWGVPLDKVTLTIGRSYAGKRGKQRILHGSPLADGDVMDLHAVPVTTPSRTVVDLARSLPLVPSVCLGDHALRTGLTTRLQLSDALDAARNRTGIEKARQSVASMSDHSRSVGESRSRMLLDTLPLPPPLLDRWLFDDDGEPVGRVPFLYPEQGVVGEFLGTGTHGAEPPTHDLANARARRTMEDLGWVVTQWTWPQLDSPRELTDRIARAFVRAAALPTPRGRVERAGPTG